MIPLPNANEVPIGAEWVLTCPRVNGFNPPAGQPVQKVLWRAAGGNQVVEWSYAVINPLNLGTGTDTNDAIRQWVQTVVGYAADDAGHVVGKQLGGSGTVQWNIFPQSRNFNRGAYNSYVEAVVRNVGQRNLITRAWYNFTNFSDANRPLRAGSFQFLLLFSDGSSIANDLLNP